MMTTNKEQKIYIAGMATLYVVLDLAGVSHWDKFALSLLLGAVAPLFFPRFTAKLLKPA
jgi:anti-anti-sigma regulatory factor